MTYRNPRENLYRYPMLYGMQNSMTDGPKDWFGTPIPILDRDDNHYNNGNNQMRYHNGLYYPDSMDSSIEDNQEIEYWKSMYPEKMKKIQRYVEDALEEEDYSGSFIYDEHPDKNRVRQMEEKIYNTIMQKEEWSSQSDLYDMEMPQFEPEFVRPPRPPMPPGPQPPRPPMPPRPYPPSGPSQPNNWLRDVVSILLYQELYHRRCHRKGCFRKYY